MGSRVDNRASGSHGDAGFFSLGRGKNLSTYAGGVLVTSDDQIAVAIETRLAELNRPGLFGELSALLKITAYGMFLKPSCYWIPANLPFLGLGETTFDTDFPIGRLSGFQTCAGALFVERLARINNTRVDNARHLAEGLLAAGVWEIPGYSRDHCPVYLRLPVLCPDRYTRDGAVGALNHLGIIATPMYPSTIRRIEGIEPYLASVEDEFAGAQTVVKRLLSLPTHPYVRDRDIRRMIACLTGEQEMDNAETDR